MRDTPRVPSDPTSTFDAILQFVVTNPQALANYATLGSALTALVVATITFRQLRINRSAVELNRAALDESRRQAKISEQALVTSLVEARKDRLNERAPNVSVVLLPGSLRFTFSEEGLDHESDLIDQFETAVRNSESSSREFRIQRLVPEHSLRTQVWLTGDVIFRNEGQSSATVSPFTLFFERIDGAHVIRLDETSFLLEPGARTVIRWIEPFNIVHWMRDARKKFDSGGADYSTNPAYNFKYLGVDKDLHFVSVTSSTIPALGDHYRASLFFLPLCDEQYDSRAEESIYRVHYESPTLELRSRVRSYPDSDEDYERE